MQTQLTDAQTAFNDVTDPFALWQAWFAEAEANEPNDPNAMALASVDASGAPNVRVVLLKGWGRDGFVFYTNTESQKGRELTHAGQAGGQDVAAANFHWKSLLRQVRLRGPVRPVEAAEADSYYASRPRGSRIGAWASRQSRAMAARDELLGAVVAREAAFEGADDIPRPANWSGFRLMPTEIEFWQDRQFRLHDRVAFRRSMAAAVAGDDAGWAVSLLYP